MWGQTYPQSGCLSSARRKTNEAKASSHNWDNNTEQSLTVMSSSFIPLPFQQHSRADKNRGHVLASVALSDYSARLSWHILVHNGSIYSIHGQQGHLTWSELGVRVWTLIRYHELIRQQRESVRTIMTHRLYALTDHFIRYTWSQMSSPRMKLSDSVSFYYVSICNICYKTKCREGLEVLNSLLQPAFRHWKWPWKWKSPTINNNGEWPSGLSMLHRAVHS